jgi:hypothetical protein
MRHSRRADTSLRPSFPFLNNSKPVSLHPRYREIVIRMFPKLKKLDQGDVTDEERKRYGINSADAEMEQLLAVARGASRSMTGRGGAVRPSHVILGSSGGVTGSTSTSAAPSTTQPIAHAARRFNEAAPFAFGRPPRDESAEATAVNSTTNGVLTAAICLVRELDTPALERLIATAKDVIAQRLSGGNR